MSFDPNLQLFDSTRFDQIFSKSSLHYTGIDNWSVGLGFNFTRETGIADRLINRENGDSLLTAFEESAIYADLKYDGIQNLTLSFGNRYTIHSIYDNAITNTVQAKYTINSKWSISSSYGEGYRSPTLKELYLEFIDQNHNIIGNVNLQPERSYDLQSTLTYTPRNSTTLSINGYFTNIRDQIALAEYETLKFQYNNIDKFTTYGFQPSVTIQTKNLEINTSASIGYWSSYLTEAGDPQYGRNIDMSNTMTYSWLKSNSKIMLNHRYVGDQPTFRLQNDEIVVGSIQGYNLLGASLSKPLMNGKINFTAGIRNISNTQNTEVLNNTGGTHSGGRRNIISIGRSYFVNLSFTI